MRYALPPFLQGTRPRFASGTLMSLPEGIATPRTRLDSREAHPVLARQLRVRLHKALRSRTRGTENAHPLIAHRLKQAQQLRGTSVAGSSDPSASLSCDSGKCNEPSCFTDSSRSGTLMSLQEGIAVLRARMVVLKPSCPEPSGRCLDLPYGVTAMPST